MSAFDSMPELKRAIREGIEKAAGASNGPPHVHHFEVDPTGTVGHCRCGASLRHGMVVDYIEPPADNPLTL